MYLEHFSEIQLLTGTIGQPMDSLSHVIDGKEDKFSRISHSLIDRQRGRNKDKRLNLVLHMFI